jgi:hypothetical protein
MWTSAWRAFLLLNGGWIQFGLSQPCVPKGSVRKVCRSGLSSIFGMKSIGGCSHQSTLPAASSSDASQGSGKEGIVHQITMVARDVGGRPDGIEDLKIGLCNET